MLVPFTVGMIAELCPGELAHCEATDGCMGEVWSHIGDFGSCTDSDLRSHTHGNGALSTGCLHRACPAKMQNCWMPTGTEICTAQLVDAMTDFGPERGLLDMDHQLLDVFLCWSMFSQQRHYDVCADDQNTCNAADLDLAVQCGIEQEYFNMLDGHPLQTGIIQVSANLDCATLWADLYASVDCAACLTAFEASRSGGGGDGR
jgi:hypothetical protein